MRLIQYQTATGERRVGLVDGEQVHTVLATSSTRELALAAIGAGHGLQDEVLKRGSEPGPLYRELLEGGLVLAPLDHEDPAHCLVSGTGLTHLGSADTRDKMHQKKDQDEATLTDTARMFRWGVEGGKPGAGQVGAQPEWFYKGDGSIVLRPGADFPLPTFAEDVGEEPELVGLYVIGPDSKPYRLGYALGNELSDHVLERRSYLYLAHSKLRFCAYGPELRIGALPANLVGTSRIHRNGEVLWEKEFLSGEQNMCHSLENLEYHHFKYRQFLRPGDVHVHFFGTATLSFADAIKPQPGDTFEIEIPEFGAALRTGIVQDDEPLAPGGIVGL